MTKRQRENEETLDAPELAQAGDAGAGDLEAPEGEEPAVVAEVSESTEALEQELEELRDRHLRLAAEYDNYRKRVLRERADLRSRLQADLTKMMLDAIDDLSRVTAVDAESASAADIIAGVDLVERKVMKELEGIGLKRVGQVGEMFDPNEHEAVGADTPSAPEQEGTISMVLQPGYKLGELLVRPARVRVHMASEQD